MFSKVRELAEGAKTLVLGPELYVASHAVQAALTAALTEVLLAPVEGGDTYLRSVYRTTPYRHQRNIEVKAHVQPFLARKFRNEWVDFKADLPDSGACRFYLAHGKTFKDLERAPDAFEEVNLNLLAVHEEWVVPPKPKLVPPSPQPVTRVQGQAATAQPRMNSGQTQPSPRAEVAGTTTHRAAQAMSEKQVKLSKPMPKTGRKT